MVRYDRRRAERIPVGVYVRQLVDDEPLRCFTTNLSRTGMYMERLRDDELTERRSSRLVQVELPLPGQRETLWAKGEIVYDCADELFYGTAVRFTAMAQRHVRWLCEWLQASRRSLDRAWGEVVHADHGIDIVRPPVRRALTVGSA